MTDLEFRMLGPLEVLRHGAALPLGTGRPQALLALLLVYANQVVPTDRLLDELWRGDPPPSAPNALQVHVSNLRRLLEPERRPGSTARVVVTRRPGYVLEVPPDCCDARRFEVLVAKGGRALDDDRPADAARILDEALALWRGPVLADLADEPFVQTEATRLEELQLVATERWTEAQLALGRPGDTVSALEALVRKHPFREHLWAQLIVALYRSGRQADALRAFQRLRQVLGDELGLEPSPELRLLEAAVLRHDPELALATATTAAAPVETAFALVTFMLTDIEGSTAAWEAEPTPMAAALARHDSLVAEAVAAHGGRLLKTRGEGDSTFSVFERASAAVGAAWALRQALALEPWPTSTPLRVRVAVHTGEAEVRDGDYFGRAVNRAARLRAVAHGGQLLLSRATADLVADTLPGGAALVDRGDRVLRDLHRPEYVFELCPATGVAEAAASGGGELEPDASLPPLPPLLSTGGPAWFAGRAPQLALLADVWKEAASGVRRSVLVSGEPGVGKTRLAAEAAQRVHAAGGMVLYGRCEEDLGVPYEPFVEALGWFCQHTPAAELPSRLGRFPGELVRLLPDLPRIVPGLDPPLRSDPETERYRFFEAVASWLDSAGDPGGLFLVVDDLHWAPPPTLALLAHVVRAADPAPLLVLGTFRDTEVGRHHPLAPVLADLRRIEGIERLALAGLSIDELAELLEERGGVGSGPALAVMLHEATDGNPFFVREVLRHAAESGLTVGPLLVPEGVREVIVSRVARLSPLSQELLAIASVLGRATDLGTLALVADADEDLVVDALDEALAARLVEETGVGAYRFFHALVRTALYESLSASRRGRLHLRAADAYERRSAEEAAHLAHHLIAAMPLSGPERTAAACLMAGNRALEVLADTEAAGWYREGLAASNGEAEPSLSIDLLTGLGEAQRRTGDATFRQTLLDAARRAARQGDAARLARAVLANNRGFTSVIGHVDDERIELIETALDLAGSAPSAERAQLLALLAAELAFGADHHRRLAAADEAAAIAGLIEDVTVRAKVGLRRLAGCLVPDRVLALVSEGADVIGLADASGDPQLRALARVWWVAALFQAGSLRQAREATSEAMAIGEETGHPGLRSTLQTMHAAAIDALGEHVKAAQLTQAAFELGQAAGHPDAPMWYGGRMILHWTYEGQADLGATVGAQASSDYPRMMVLRSGWVLDRALTGHTEDVADAFAGLSDTLSAASVDMFWVATHFQFAVAMGFGVEDRAAAVLLYDRLLPYRTLHAAYNIGYWGPVEIALGVLARVLGDTDLALAHHEAAAAVIEGCGAARARALNGYQWALTLHARGTLGERQRGHQLLEETLTYARAQGYATFEEKAEQALAELGSR